MTTPEVTLTVPTAEKTPAPPDEPETSQITPTTDQVVPAATSTLQEQA